MPTTVETAENLVRANISVQRFMVIMAKDYIVNSIIDPQISESGLTTSLLRNFLQSLQVSKPTRVVIHESTPIEPQAKAVALHFSWQLAFIEGLLDLVHRGVLIIKRSDMVESEDHQAWTTVIPGLGGNSGGWSFIDLRVIFPRQVILAPSYPRNETNILLDGDLYLKHLAIPNLHPEIATFLFQAVECFRAELFLPAVIMLGSASEIIWNELGLSLLKYANSKALPQPIIAKHRSPLEDSDAGIAHKINAIVDFYQVRQDIFSDLKKSSQMSPEILKSVGVWAHTIRDSRNALHGGGSRIPHTFESIAVFLLSTPNNVRSLYSLHDAANSLAGGVI